MYINSAYVGKKDEDIVTLNKPLFVTAAGYNKVITRRIIETMRPRGRHDYQLIYIAAGKVRFYFNGQERIITKGNMVLFRPGVQQIYYHYAVDKPES